MSHTLTKTMSVWVCVVNKTHSQSLIHTEIRTIWRLIDKLIKKHNERQSSLTMFSKYLHIYIYYGCNDTRMHIEPFSTKLSVRYALQTERFFGLILLRLENKRAWSVWNIMFSVPLHSTTQHKWRNRQRAVCPVITSSCWGASTDGDLVSTIEILSKTSIIGNIKRIWHFQLM